MLNKQQLHVDFRIQMKPIQNLVFCQCLSQCLHFTCRKTLNYFTENENLEIFFWRSDKKQSSRYSNLIPQVICLVISIHSAIISEYSIFFILLVICKQWAQVERLCYQTYFQDFPRNCTQFFQQKRTMCSVQTIWIKIFVQQCNHNWVFQ